MRTKKWALTFLVVFAGMVLFTAQSAFGGCEVASLDLLIYLNDKAPKTKYEGPITLYFHPVFVVDEYENQILIRTDAYLFLRLRKGSNLFAFADVIEDVTYSEFIDDPLAVTSFFDDTVLPGLYPAVCPGDCPPSVLKSYDLDVSHDDPPAGSPLQFFVVDIVLAVQD